MKKNLILPILLALFILACDKDDVSQKQVDSFVKYFANYREFSAADVVQLNTSGYAILGTAKTPGNGTEICLLITDEYGNTVDSARLYGKSYGELVSDEKAFCLHQLDDGGFALLGSSENPVTQNLEVYFIRTNSIGDTLWTRTLTVDGNVEARHFEVDDNGSFYITGYRDDMAEYGKEVWLFALTGDGSNHYNWSQARNFGFFNNDDEGTHIQILNNGHLAITGRTKSSTSGGINQSFIIITNEKGISDDWYVIEPDTEQIEPETELEGTCLREVDDDKYLVLNTAKSSTGTSISLKYVNMDARRVEWTETYGESGKDISRSLLIVGSSYYILGTTTITSTSTAIFLISTDASGNQKGVLQYGLGTELTGSAFEQTADGGFIIVGTNKHKEDDIAVALIKTAPGDPF